MVLLSGVVLCFECWMIQFAIPVPARMKAFNKEFMEQFK
jgi:hypothetical protein